MTEKNTKILGISALYHDAAAALIVRGDIVAAAHEERFTRKKHDPSFPVNAVQYCLAEGGTDLEQLDAIAFYDKPFIKFERLLETYHAFAPRGLASFSAAIPVWIKEKLFTKKLIRDELKKIAPTAGRLPPLLFPEHHLSHAASAFYPSPFADAAILTVDGVGEWATTTLCEGRGSAVTIRRELTFPHSLGLLYSAFTAYCGFKVNSGEYKLMGLAPYGNPGAERTRRFRDAILSRLLDVREDGSLLCNMEYFNYAVGLTMCQDEKWRRLFGIPRRGPETELGQEHMDLALAVQQVTEMVMLRLARTAQELTGLRNLVMAGGVALNCVANGKILREKIFDRVWVQPAAGDAGGALGAALAVHYIHDGHRRTPREPDAMMGSYLGPAFSSIDIQRTVRRYDAPFTHFNSFDDLAAHTASLLAGGKIVGWFQGRMEWGPRALGNRSILADPRNPKMQKTLNLSIKYREGFRPFAPSILEEHATDFFELGATSPYMLLVAQVAADRQTPLPDNYDQLSMYDRLYVTRSTIPAVTHVDNSARIQTVSQSTNLRYWTLIHAFQKATGCPLLVNTSFNVRGEPIVCSPDDAYRCFMRTEMDILVLGDFLFVKTDQPAWEEKEKWQQTYELD